MSFTRPTPTTGRSTVDERSKPMTDITGSPSMASVLVKPSTVQLSTSERDRRLVSTRCTSVGP